VTSEAALSGAACLLERLDGEVVVVEREREGGDQNRLLWREPSHA
jgi:hypothetical protein